MSKFNITLLIRSHKKTNIKKNVRFNRVHIACQIKDVFHGSNSNLIKPFRNNLERFI